MQLSLHFRDVCSLVHNRELLVCSVGRIIGLTWTCDVMAMRGGHRSSKRARVAPQMPMMNPMMMNPMTPQLMMGQAMNPFAFSMMNPMMGVGVNQAMASHMHPAQMNPQQDTEPLSESDGEAAAIEGSGAGAVSFQEAERQALQEMRDRRAGLLKNLSPDNKITRSASMIRALPKDSGLREKFGNCTCL